MDNIERKYPKSFEQLGLLRSVGVPDFPLKVMKFLREQIGAQPNGGPLRITARPYVYHSARGNFYSPSDLSGIGGMRFELIVQHLHGEIRGPDTIVSLSKRILTSRASKVSTSREFTSFLLRVPRLDVSLRPYPLVYEN